MAVWLCAMCALIRGCTFCVYGVYNAVCRGYMAVCYACVHDVCYEYMDGLAHSIHYACYLCMRAVCYGCVAVCDMHGCVYRVSDGRGKSY